MARGSPPTSFPHRNPSHEPISEGLKRWEAPPRRRQVAVASAPQRRRPYAATSSPLNGGATAGGTGEGFFHRK